MQILETLQDRIPEAAGFRRITILDSNCGAAHVSVVLVRVPPGYEFPVHVHPRSEDCFFVLSGEGEARSLNRSFSISEVSGVWVPAGVPHGLTAGPAGIVEVGFQSPPGPTVETTESATAYESRQEILAESIPLKSVRSHSISDWYPVFARRPGCQYLEPQYRILEMSQELEVVAGESEFVIVVARGAIAQRHTGTEAEAITIIHLNQGESVVIHALKANTLLLGVRVSAA